MSAQRVNLILIILFIVIGGLKTFGIAWYWFSIPTSVFNITDSFLILIYLLSAALLNKRKVGLFKNMLLPFGYIFILLAFQIVRGFFLQDLSIAEILKRLIPIYTVVFFFTVIKLVKTEFYLKTFIKSLYWMALFASFVYLVQLVFGINFQASGGVAEYSGIRRINNPGVFIISIASILGFSEIISNSGNSNKSDKIFIYIVFFMSILVCLLTLSRGFILGIFTAYALILYNRLKSTGQIKNIANYLFIFSFVILLVVLSFIFLGIDVSIVNDRMMSGIEEVSTNSGTYSTRSNMVTDKISTLINEKPAFGAGLDYNIYDETVSRAFIYNDPYSLNSDSTYQNIILVFGLTGTFLFLWLFYRIYKFGMSLYKRTEDSYTRTYSVALAATPVFYFIHGFSSSYFSAIGLLMISLSISLLYLLDEQDTIRKLTTNDFKKEYGS